MNEERRRLNLPDRRKNTYDQLEGHLDERLDKIEERVAKWLRRGLYAFAIVGITSTVALGGFGYVLRAVQIQRYELCVEQNAEHDNTESQLRAAAAIDEFAAKTEAAKAEIRRRRDVTIELIDALAPKRNCRDTVEVIGGFGIAEPSPTPTPTRTPTP